MLKRFSRSSVVVLLVAALGVAATASARPGSVKKEPLVITAKRMGAEQLGDRVTFEGDVVLKKEDMTLYSDTLVVRYDARTKGIRDIEALGNVVVRKENRVAIAEKAVYTSNEEKIVLTGDARIIENENQLGGERITLFLREDRSVVEGGNVLFYQDASPAPPKQRSDLEERPGRGTGGRR